MGKNVNRYIEFKEAKDLVIKLSLKSRSDYKKYFKNNILSIPMCPNIVYKEWISWSDWLGNDNIFCGNRVFPDYETARKIVSKLNISRKCEWEIYHKKNNIKNLPLCPNLAYKNKGWVSWSDWLSNTSRSDRFFPSLKEAKKILKSNNICYKSQYLNFYKENNLPSHPISTYNINSWSDILCNNKSTKLKLTKEKRDKFLCFEDARSIVNNMLIISQNEWYNLTKLDLIPINIPKTPNKFYKEWISWNNWLGHSITTYKKFITYKEAKEFVKNLNFSSIIEYYDYLISNNIEFLPLNPLIFYKKEWEGSSIFLSNDEKESYGEKKIKKYLDINNIKYEQQKTFEGCLNKKKLLFDFFIPNLNTCIEFDGAQHFKVVDWFGGKEGYIKRKENDIIKNNFCEINKINLLRISYEDINIIDKILSDNNI